MPSADPNRALSQGALLAMMAALFGLGLTNIFMRSTLGVIAPELAGDLGLSPFVLGLTGSAYFFAYAVFQIPSGMMLDRFGPRLTICTLFVVTTFGAWLFSVAESDIAVVIGRIFMGLGCAAVFPGAIMLFARFYPPDRLPSVTGSLNSFAMLGTFLATFPLAYLVTQIGWRDSFVLIAICAAVISGFAFLTLRDWPVTPDEAPRQLREGPREVLAGVLQAIRTPYALNIASGGIALSAGNIFLGVWGGPYLHDVHGLSETQRGEVLMFMAFAGVAGHFIFGKLARVLNTLKGLVLFGAAGAVVIMILFATLTEPSRLTVTVLFTVLGFVCGYPGIMMSHARAIMPDHLMGRGLTVVNTGIMISIAVMQTAVGWVIGVHGAADADSYRTAFIFIAVMAALSFVIYSRAEDRKPRSMGPS